MPRELIEKLWKRGREFLGVERVLESVRSARHLDARRIAEAIHAELVQLAGADEMVQLAGRKAAAGEHEQALHLLDIVLNADPGHAGARALAIRVHQALLADAKTFCTTGNFWLVGWLQTQVKLLGGGETPTLSVE